MKLSWHTTEKKSEASSLMIVGRKQFLTDEKIKEYLPENMFELWSAMLAEIKAVDAGQSVSTFYSHEGKVKRLIAGVLPEECSRHNCAARPHAITALLREQAPRTGTMAVHFMLEDPEHCFAASCASARAFSEYSKKTSETKTEQPHIALYFNNVSAAQLKRAEEAALAVRNTMTLVDTPTSEMYTDKLIEQALSQAKALGCKTTVIQGEALKEQGLGGLYHVGKAARYKPALVVLAHEPANATETIVWVGKGIVYDTGGLSLKGSDHMTGMKGDMGGAAAVLNAFTAAVRQNFKQRLYALLCIAENAIGPDATRPDDIITLYSGKNIEVNNTDAEGRLVLGDGLAYAVKHLQPDVIVDVATLTGAQSVATGKKHAAVVSNQEVWEQKAVKAGLQSGDLVHPLPYCPEFFRSEFKSDVADLKNSVKDRTNAPSSCAGQFLAEQLGAYKKAWLHVDIAGTSGINERATGFGVGLLLELFFNQKN